MQEAASDNQIPDRAPASLIRRIVRALWSLVKGLLYLAFVVVVVVVLLWGLDRLAYRALGKSPMAAVYPHDLALARLDFTRPISYYDYDFNPRVCLEYNVLKGNRYEYANNAGFREPRDIAMEKPADEYRIFLNGGSTAYGMGAIGEAVEAMSWYGIEYRETISHMMEMILNASAPIQGKRIRVYNTAVWGYAYQHHVGRYLAKLRNYQPDLIISLDGANEIAPACKIMKDWNYYREGQFNNILQDIFAYNRPGLASYLTLWMKNNTYLMTFFWGGRDVFTEMHQRGRLEGFPAQMDDTAAPPSPHATADTHAGMSLEEKSRIIDRNVDTIVRIIENYHSVMENDAVPHMLVLQPWFYLSKKNLSEKEKILKGMTGHREYFGVPSANVYKLIIDKTVESAQKKGYFLVDFHDYFDDVSEWVFTDWCHLTSGANYLLAKELSNLVKERVFARELTAGDMVENKDGYFWDLCASATVVHATDPESSGTGVKNMLAGYPGDHAYVSKTPGAQDRNEVVLDTGQTHPVTRLRLVWADPASVPDKWVVEVSLDGSAWTTFCQGDNKLLDGYARWPGIEYYAPQPVPARFLKYRPVSPENSPMKVRCWSMMR